MALRLFLVSDYFKENVVVIKNDKSIHNALFDRKNGRCPETHYN
jgi:hypothetical protein